VRAGLLRHQITFQSPTVIPSEISGQEITWTDEATVWADIEPFVGREYFSAKQVNADVTHTVKIRFLAGLKASWRIDCSHAWFSPGGSEERYLYIESIINDGERDRSMTLVCREVA
jgi:SPP1 family predicted phage head-tail adaptor